MAEDRETGPRAAEVIDGVAWDYDPEDDRLSPLVSARRYFRDFPWQPEAVTVDQPAGGGARSESASAAITRR